jgi:hypothetical protein
MSISFPVAASTIERSYSLLLLQHAKNKSAQKAKCIALHHLAVVINDSQERTGAWTRELIFFSSSPTSGARIISAATATRSCKRRELFDERALNKGNRSAGAEQPVWDEPKLKSLRAELIEKLTHKMMASSVPAAGWSKRSQMRGAQVSLFVFVIRVRPSTST